MKVVTSPNNIYIVLYLYNPVPNYGSYHKQNLITVTCLRLVYPFVLRSNLVFGLHFIEAIFYLKKFSTICTTEMTNLIMNIGKSRISPLYEVAATAIPGSVSPLLSSQEIRKPVNKMLYQNHPFHKYQAPEWKLSNSTWALGKSGPSNSFGLTAIAGIGGESSISLIF